MRGRGWMVVGMLLIGSSVMAQPKPDKPDTKPDMKMQAPPPKAAKAPPPMSDAKQIKLAMSAGPADIAKNASIMTVDEKFQMRELRAGTNGWMCMAVPEAMCADKEWQGFIDAWVNKKDPHVKSVGIAYMLRGDQGASNTDPFATGPTADNNWIVSPPHIMVLSPDTKLLESLPTDPNTGGPWVMWKGTKYAHIMVPTVAMPAKKANVKPTPK